MIRAVTCVVDWHYVRKTVSFEYVARAAPLADEDARVGHNKPVSKRETFHEHTIGT